MRVGTFARFNSYGSTDLWKAALMKIAYLAHDLTDPAIHRRVAMLAAGGARVALAGLSRGAAPHPGALVLGRSADGRLAQRAWQIAAVIAARRPEVLAHLGQPDVLIARNLEMLAVAVSLIPRFRTRPRVVYECLDIHRLLTDQGTRGKALRLLEKRLAPYVDLVITSSPAFVTHHLGHVFGDRIAIVENRVLDLGQSPLHAQNAPPSHLPGPPWRIGWFGALRCRKSLDILSEAARLAHGRIEIVIRGRPSAAVFGDFAAQISGRPYLRFEGPYHMGDLGSHYAGVHFAWGVDLYEAGANSDWLLPNRLYESVHHGSVPIARLNCEMGRFLLRHDIGLLLPDLSPNTLAQRLGMLGAQDYCALQKRQRRLPREMWRADHDDCVDLVMLLANIAPQVEPKRVTL